MIKNEIKNKIQLEIINVSKTITYKRRGTESKKNDEKMKKEKEKKKEKKRQFQVTSHRTTTHAPPIGEEDPGQIK